MKGEYLEAGLRRQDQETRLEIERVQHVALQDEVTGLRERAEALAKAKAEVWAPSWAS